MIKFFIIAIKMHVIREVFLAVRATLYEATKQLTSDHCTQD